MEQQPGQRIDVLPEDVTVRFPDGSSKTYLKGMMKSEALADLQKEETSRAQAPRNPIAGLNPPPQQQLQRQPGTDEGFYNLMETGGDLMSLVAGLTPLRVAGLPLKMIASAIGGGISGGANAAAQGGGIGDVAKSAGLNAILQGGMEGASVPAAKAIRRGGYRLGARVGGADPESASRLAAAHIREGERSILNSEPGGGVMQGLPLGAKKRAQARMDSIGEQIPVAEKFYPQMEAGSNPYNPDDAFTIPLKNLEGATEAETKKVSGKSVTRRAAMTAEEQKRIRESGAAVERNPQTGKRLLEGRTPEEYERVKELLDDPANRRSYDDLRISVSDLGDIGRAQRADASKLIRARVDGTAPYNPDQVDDVAASSLARRALDQRNALATKLDPKQAEKLKLLQERYSDLATIKEGAEGMRGGGLALTEMGPMSVRGGFGAGITNNLRRMGIPIPEWAPIMALLGLAPSMISRAGNTTANLVGAAPTMQRAADAATPRRRKP